MKKARKLYTSFEQLPLTLNADDIAAYLNISRGNAYTLLHREDFPTLRIGKRMIAPRDKFLAWLDQQMCESDRIQISSGLTGTGICRK